MASIAAVVRAPLHGPLGVEALGLLSAPGRVRMSDATVTVSMVGGGPSLRLVGGRRGALDAGAGVMAAFVRVAGIMSPSQNTPVVYGRIGGGLAFTPWLGLRAEVLVGGTLIEPRLRTDMSMSQDLASWGVPFGTGMLSLEARWL
jgi:hypothetical protein